MASRARLAKRGREIEEELVGGQKSPSKTEKAHVKVMRVRKLLAEIDEELPTLHYLLADVEFLARPNKKAEPRTPPAVARSREVLESIKAQAVEPRNGKGPINNILMVRQSTRVQTTRRTREGRKRRRKKL